MKKTLTRILLAILGLLTGAFVYIWQIMGSAVFVDIPFRQENETQVPEETYQGDDVPVITPAEEDLTGNRRSRIRLYAPAQYPIVRVNQIDPMVTNVLVFGIDARSDSEYISRSDTMIVVSLDRHSNTAKLTSLMRDTEVRMAGSGQDTKLNAAYATGGVGHMINTINQKLELDIQYFAMLDFWSAAGVVDAVDGVTITVTEEEVGPLNTSVSEFNAISGLPVDDGFVSSGGEQLLSGKQAVAWARIRSIDSDYARTGRQRTLMAAVMDKFNQMGTLKQLDVATEMLALVATNVVRATMMSMAASNLSTLQNMEQYRMPADEFSYTNTDNWNIIVDWGQQVPDLHRFIYGTYSTKN